MKKILVVVIIFLSPVVCFSQPLIVFDTETYDFGTVAQTEKIEHTFDFKNRGNEELVIQRLQPG